MKEIVSFFRSFIVAFSIYSKIPMPRFEWDGSDMRYHLVFFPFVGALAGAIGIGCYHLGLICGAERLPFVLIAGALIILFTGGLHIDGMMDTMDAIHSYQPKEKKLEIMKDPHVGAFAIISLAVYLMLFIAFVYDITDKSAWYILCSAPVISRALCGLLIMTTKNAKDEGMLKAETKDSPKRLIIAFLTVELVIILALVGLLSIIAAGALIIVQLLVLVFYRRMACRQFGGMSGDLAGCYVCISELFTAFSLFVLGKGGIL